MSAHSNSSATPSHEANKQQYARRLAVWGLCIVTYCLTLALLRSTKMAIGLDPFSVVWQGFIPVGAMCVAAVAISGFMIGAHFLKLQADRWDLLFLMLACLLLQFVIVAIDYWLFLYAHSELAGHVGYGRYFAMALTTPEFVSTSSQFGPSRPQAIGTAGYLLLLPRLGCLLGIGKFAHSKFEVPTDYSV